jgi:hypothetical protein
VELVGLRKFKEEATLRISALQERLRLTIENCSAKQKCTSCISLRDVILAALVSLFLFGEGL